MKKKTINMIMDVMIRPSLLLIPAFLLYHIVLALVMQHYRTDTGLLLHFQGKSYNPCCNGSSTRGSWKVRDTSISNAGHGHLMKDKTNLVQGIPRDLGVNKHYNLFLQKKVKDE